MTIYFGLDPVRQEIARVLELLAVGTNGEQVESKHVDLKEEAGRRQQGGALGPSLPHNEDAASALAGACVCMANTDGGGALIVGVADGGELIGTNLDAEWLRSRIYDLTVRALTADVTATTLNGARLLVLVSPQAIEPLRYKGRITWRVDDRCVEVDAATWLARRMIRTHFDWSAQPSTVPLDQVRAGAIEQAREYLRASNEDSAMDLAGTTQPDLLRRLNVVTSDGYLTNAGVLAFVGRPDPCLDYIRREVTAGDSVHRVRRTGRSLLEEVAEVVQSVAAYNDVRHISQGLAVGQIRELPERAVREAIVNGVVHREWGSASPTVVEHTGRTLRVTSPGGFVGGVTPQNIITHPSQTRNRALAELFAALRVAEREGIGVDRMVRDMVRLGHAAPDIDEIAGPHVRTALIGDAIDEGWLAFLSRFRPAAQNRDLNTLLLARRLVDKMWVDVESAQPLLQLGAAETAAALHVLSTVTVSSAPLVELVSGVPSTAPPAWHFSSDTLALLHEDAASTGTGRRELSRDEVALNWARGRGRVSTTELASIVGASPSNVSAVLRGLERDGLLRPSRANRRGAGFYYLPVSGEQEC